MERRTIRFYFGLLMEVQIIMTIIMISIIGLTYITIIIIIRWTNSLMTTKNLMLPIIMITNMIIIMMKCDDTNDNNDSIKKLNVMITIFNINTNDNIMTTITTTYYSIIILLQITI